jgi:superfamily II DNA/RNA helicase
VRGPNLIHAPSLCSGSKETTSLRDNSFGAKLDAIADLIGQLPGDDQAIIFVPNEESANPIEELLSARDITFASVSGRRTKAARIIEDFKNDKDPQTRDKVLILNLGDESASGV